MWSVVVGGWCVINGGDMAVRDMYHRLIKGGCAGAVEKAVGADEEGLHLVNPFNVRLL